jgi:hypothetical protein
VRRYIHKVKVFLWVLIVGFLADQVWGIELPGDFNMDVGMGFDWVGQRYRLSDQDTLDQFDETTLSMIFGYGGGAEKGLAVENKVALSDRSVKNLLTGTWSTGIFRDARIRLENQLEFKEYWWQGVDLFGSSYAEGRFRVDGWWPLGSSLRLGTEQRLSYVNYQKNSSYFRDYWLSQSTACLEAELGWMWNLVFDYSLARRDVPDSSGMDYVSHSLASSLSGLMGWSVNLHLDTHLERRLSARPQGRQDYLNLAGQSDIEYELGSGFSLVFRGELEQMAYDHPDEVYYDYWSASGKLGFSRDFSPVVTVALLPTYNRSKAAGTSIGETYDQLGIELGMDYSGTGRLWASLTLELGARNYEETEEESFYSGYTYFRPTLFLTYRLTDEISLDLFADHDPEWHKQKEDDFTTSLLSCSLSYRFP